MYSQDNYSFLDDIPRILIPEDHDILRANMRTKDVEEHHILVQKGEEMGINYCIIDVGGSRSQRPSWQPLFNDVDAIVFLAPLVFNELLEEDVKVNRMEDSILLWKEICENKLLAKAHMVLFLNKIDILTAMLEAGIQVNKYVPSYKNQPNELSHVIKYFRTHFRAVHTDYSPERRTLYCYQTSATTKNTSYFIIGAIREQILLEHQRNAGFI